MSTNIHSCPPPAPVPLNTSSCVYLHTRKQVSEKSGFTGDQRNTHAHSCSVMRVLPYLVLIVKPWFTYFKCILGIQATIHCFLFCVCVKTQRHIQLFSCRNNLFRLLGGTLFQFYSAFLCRNFPRGPRTFSQTLNYFCIHGCITSFFV